MVGQGPLEIIWSISPAQAGPPRARTVSTWLLNNSKEGDPTSFLGNLCQCLVTVTARKMFPGVHTAPPVFHFVPIASGSVTRHHWEESGSFTFAPSLQVFIDVGKIPPEPFLRHAEQWQLSQPFLVEEMLQSPVHWNVSLFIVSEDTFSSCEVN